MLFERHETYESNERQERVNLIRIAIVKYFMVTCMVYIYKYVRMLHIYMNISLLIL